MVNVKKLARPGKGQPPAPEETRHNLGKPASGQKGERKFLGANGPMNQAALGRSVGRNVGYHCRKVSSNS
jgi:hypothetical protein